MPNLHHVHVNSVDPERALDWYAGLWPSGQKTTVAGFPAFQAEMAILYTRVDAPAPGAWRKEQRRPDVQSPFWHIGVNTNTKELHARLDKTKYDFMPLYSGPDDAAGVPHSRLSPLGHVLLTLAQREERLKSGDIEPPETATLDFAYLLDPDGILVESNGTERMTPSFSHVHFFHELPLCAANWYVEHLGMQLPQTRSPQTGETSETPPWAPCEVPVGEPSYLSLEPIGTLRDPRGTVRYADGAMSWYTRQCRMGRCREERPLSRSRGQVVDHVAFTYPDLDAVMASLAATGVPILEGPYAFGETRAILIEDLDGLALELIEMRE
jgi:catechol 2,3-dioxygenase-like lactoylglutathione lyase family enzyme